MGTWNSVSRESPLGCTLLNWNKFDPQVLKKRLTFLCNIAWPLYKLEDGECWTKNGSLNYNTVLQLDCICHKLEKMDRSVLCPGLYCSKDNPDLYHSCKINPSVLALVTHPPRGSNFGGSSSDILQPLLTEGPEETAFLNWLSKYSQRSLTSYPGPPSSPKICPLQEVVGNLLSGSGKVLVPCSMQDLIK